jgi:DNA-directed RNA polymerase subunit RPC12/RpoP
MAISFHCNYCGKKIEAKAEAAGKWGKCPSCHNRIYVPNLEVKDDLKLAPVDEEAEKRKQRLMAETFNLEQEILKERIAPEVSKEEEPAPSAGFAGISDEAVDEEALYNTIVRYLRQMADGDLDDAAITLQSIESAGEISLKLIDRIALADIPEAELSDIPPQVLAGLIRTLRSKIG